MLFQAWCCGAEEEVTEINFSLVPEESVAPARGAVTACPVLLGSAPASGDQKRQLRSGAVATVLHLGHEKCSTPISCRKQLPTALKDSIGGEVPAQASPDEPLSATHSPINSPNNQADFSEDHLPAPSAMANEEDKMRIFMKKASTGCPCTVLEGRRFQRSSGEYRILEAAGLITVHLEGSGSPELTCSISQIQDIYTVEEDGKDCFPDELLAVLDPEEMDLLVMIVYSDGRRKRRTFYLLDVSRDEREMLLEVLKLLSVDAQAPQKPDSKR
mmetsp:Transcript_114576/g.335042  ORF Transcript_114576/g.335042 Transcript_114576/m.335042 type:complete len:272 (-) Transcript_114576:105-920(-)